MKEFVVGILICFGLSTNAVAQKNAYPKVSDDANVTLELSSNVPETKFIVDGKEFLAGERIKVMINKKEHVVEAIPKGYRAKKDYLQPPYIDKYAVLRFTFLLEDRLPEEKVTTITPIVTKIDEVPLSPQEQLPISGLSSIGYANRYALVIGNSNYKESPLRNPVNDARAIAQELQRLKFDVMAFVDLDKPAMKEVIRTFEEKVAKNKGVALFYYAGHGLQSNGSNYLVPIGADIQREYDIEDACIKADVVLRMLELNENPMNIIILDACRNNPYARIARSMDRGLAQPENAPKGSIIAFATAPGKTASDGDGQNGLYTQELIKALRVRGLSVEQVFKQVRINVINLSNSKQTPWENSSLLGEFFFNK
jgi:hypothetical protein